MRLCRLVAAGANRAQLRPFGGGFRPDEQQSFMLSNVNGIADLSRAQPWEMQEKSCLTGASLIDRHHTASDGIKTGFGKAA